MAAPGLNEAGQLLGRYLDALYDADADLLGRVFHPAALYITADGDEVVARSMDEYLPIVASRTSPRSVGQLRDDRLVSLSLVAPNIAVAVVESRLGNVDYTDAITMLAVGGHWCIASKVFHGSTRNA
jgi:4-oxalocrotonate tautomerase